MNEFTLSVTPPEVQVIITALNRTDPTGMYVADLINKIIEQVNPQINNPPQEVKEVKL